MMTQLAKKIDIPLSSKGRGRLTSPGFYAGGFRSNNSVQSIFWGIDLFTSHKLVQDSILYIPPPCILRSRGLRPTPHLSLGPGRRWMRQVMPYIRAATAGCSVSMTMAMKRASDLIRGGRIVSVVLRGSKSEWAKGGES